MTRTTVLSFAAGVAATAAVAFLTGLAPEERGGRAQPEVRESTMTPEQEMEMWMKAASPGPGHAFLGKAVGTWKARARFSMDPSAPPVESEGTMTVSWILGGRFTRAEFKSPDMMGMPFEGLGINGYDNNRGEYVTIWMDTMSTGVMSMTGQHEGDTLTMTGSGSSPMGEMHMRIVSTWQDDNHFTDTFYDRTEDGSWVKSGEISYTRD